MKHAAVRIEGAILGPEILDRLNRDDAAGQRPADFGIANGARVKDEIVRAWAHAQNYWRAFQEALARLKPEASATSETRQLWMLPLCRLLGYDLEYASRGEMVGGKNYPISHRLPGRDGLPVHILGARDSLDRKRSAGEGGPRMSPHALVQEYLNLTEHVYGLVSNGRQLRLLRDSTRLIRLSYIEFDLTRIFEEQIFADFALLFRLLHASRLPHTQASAVQSIIERYHQDAIDAGARIRDGLRDAVEGALLTLGNGFLAHARNEMLRVAFTDSQLTERVFYQHLLRLIYRLLFLMVIEERRLVFPPGVPVEKVRVYFEGYSIQRIRRLAGQRAARDPRHNDLWLGLRSTFALFEDEDVAARLGLSPLAGALFAPDALGPLATASLDNATLLAALDSLCTFEHPDTHQRTGVNYGALATEEFGSVYESLLELHPVIHVGPLRFSFKQAAGNERKTTGSYYTPSSLVECLLDSALDPVLEERLSCWRELGHPSAEEAVLALKVCDPAVGSGHFLIAAAQRIARRLATLRAGDDEPSPDQLRHALRQVIGRCLYGVDINPMAVELCKVTLWLEATEPGKPLSFLDHHIQCGNSLLGVTPRLLDEGLPDDAFKPIAGDDKTVCAKAKKRNKDERKQLALFHGGTEIAPWLRLGNLPAAMIAVDTMGDDTAAEVHRKEVRYAELVRSSGYLHSRFLADAWCAAFVWKKTGDIAYPITNDVLRKIERNPHDCAPWMRDEIQRLSDRYQFFHWQLAFPDVFRVSVNGEKPENKQSGWSGGFDVILANPPWERVNLKEQEWFAERRPEIANARNAAERKSLIRRLTSEYPVLSNAFSDAVRRSEGESHLLRTSGTYPLCGRGDINLYAVFAEGMRMHLNPTGRVGAVLPSGIATDETTKQFFQELVETRSLVSLFDFENRAGLFAAVDSRMKFCLLTVGSGLQRPTEAGQFVFYAHSVDDLRDPNRRFLLNANDIARLNPNSKTCPIFRTKKDAELAKFTYAALPVFVRENDSHGNPWRVDLTRMLHMADDSNLFHTRQQLEQDGAQLDGNLYRADSKVFLPLYEAKMTGAFDHRAADVVLSETATIRQGQPDSLSPEDHRDSNRLALPRYWVAAPVVDEFLRQRECPWLLSFTDVTSPTNERTMIATVLPRVAVGHTKPLIFSKQKVALQSCLFASLNSFPFDYFARQKLGGIHFTYFVFRQIPLPLPATYAEPCQWIGGAGTVADWLLPRVLELTYTAWDLAPFARDCGWFGPPFVWDEARRFQLRCELDAAFFHLYGLSRTDADYILDTFPIVRRKDEERTERLEGQARYVTKETILARYEEMQTCAATGQDFASELPIPAADPRGAHDPRLPARLRPAFTSIDYFEHVVPLVARLQPEGVDAGRLLHALEILAEADSRRAALKGHDREPWQKWAEEFPRKHAFSDATAALQVMLGDGTLTRWRGRIQVGVDVVFAEDEWLNTDAFVALRLALAMPTETVQRHRVETEQRFPGLGKLLLAV